MRALTLTLLLSACGQKQEPATDDTSVAAEEELPSPYIADEVTDDPPAYDQAAVEAAIALALDEALSWHSGPVLDAYEAAMSAASSGCPDYYESDGNTYWYDYCTSSRGASFNGYAFDYVYEDYNDGSGTVYSGRQLYAEATIDAPGVGTFEGGGYASQLEGTTSDGAAIFSSGMAGSFHWDGHGVEGTWLDGDTRPELSYWAAYYEEYNLRYVSVSGGVSGLPGDYSTLAFTDLVYSDSPWWACPGEPSGTISVRANDGTWFDIVFDVAADWTVDEAACDACGAVWRRGELVGQACPDVEGLVDWGVSPW